MCLRVAIALSVSVLTGIMSSSFTAIRNSVINFQSVSDLLASGVRVCSYPTLFNAGQLLAAIPDNRVVPGETMAACGELLRAGQTDVIVMDSPIASYWRTTTPWASDLSLSPDLDTYAIGLVFPESGGTVGPQYMEPIKPALIDFTRSPAYSALRAKWFPASDQGQGSGATNSETIQWHLVVPTIVIVAVYAALQCYLAVHAWHRQRILAVTLSSVTVDSVKPVPDDDDVTIDKAKPAPSDSQVRMGTSAIDVSSTLEIM